MLKKEKLKQLYEENKENLKQQNKPKKIKHLLNKIKMNNNDFGIEKVYKKKYLIPNVDNPINKLKENKENEEQKNEDDKKSQKKLNKAAYEKKRRSENNEIYDMYKNKGGNLNIINSRSKITAAQLKMMKEFNKN